ncbi:SDR family oxidoreductase [Pendulispora albinea]|uniref:SDR family oxidoreductase n=1 Tax=Pendulispora albinea TaxID=2741071 RepID=A0ABZ2M4U0_9BACT
MVTGASRGIGAAIARRLSAEGAAVGIGYVTNRELAEALVRELGGGAFALRADMGDAAEARASIAEAGARYGRIDVLVNNAGVGDHRPLGASDEAVFDRLFAVNVRGPLFASEEALRHFPSAGGRIVHVSSGVSRHAIRGLAVYSATKGALESLARVQTLEWGPRNVTVNVVAPGPIETELHVRSEAHTRALLERTPLGRIGRPEDVAGVVAFLAADDARWITGEVIDVDGGYV